MIATAIPGTVLAFVITFGGAIYKSDGLELVNPRDRQGFTGGSLLSPVNYRYLPGIYGRSAPGIPDRENGGLRFDRWTEVTTVKEYCWNHLGNVAKDRTHSMEYQHHYRNFFINVKISPTLKASLRYQVPPLIF